LLSFVTIAKASDEESILHYTVTNGTGAAVNTYISTSTIIPGKHRILGFAVNPITSGSGTSAAALYDAADSGDVSAANLIGEKVQANTGSDSEWFVRPIALSNGAGVSVGAGASITIYYERSRP
jgi:hypothetical protein